MTKNTGLTYLYCNGNDLTSLDVIKNMALTHLFCISNQLAAEGLSALFGTLPGNTSDKEIQIRDNPGTASCDQSIATAKGWTVVD